MTVRIRKSGIPAPKPVPLTSEQIAAQFKWQLPLNIPGRPYSTNMAYRSIRGQRGMFLTHEARTWKDDMIRRAKIEMQVRCLQMLDEPVRVTIIFHFQYNRSDIDGPVKLVVDALEAAGVFRNDTLVRALHVYKPDPEKGLLGTEVLVEPICVDP